MKQNYTCPTACYRWTFVDETVQVRCFSELLQKHFCKENAEEKEFVLCKICFTPKNFAEDLLA